MGQLGKGKWKGRPMGGSVSGPKILTELQAEYADWRYLRRLAGPRSDSSSFAYVTSADAGTVSVIETATNTVVATADLAG